MRVKFTGHAELRMIQRDITEDEVREALQAPRSVHSRSTRYPGRWEVRQRVGTRTLVVIYSRPEPDGYNIITVEWE